MTLVFSFGYPHHILATCSQQCCTTMRRQHQWPFRLFLHGRVYSRQRASLWPWCFPLGTLLTSSQRVVSNVVSLCDVNTNDLFDYFSMVGYTCLSECLYDPSVFLWVPSSHHCTVQSIMYYHSATSTPTTSMVGYTCLRECLYDPSVFLWVPSLHPCNVQSIMYYHSVTPTSTT